MTANIIASTPVVVTGFDYIKDALAVSEDKYSVQLQEWLECQDFILAAKAHSIGMLPVNADSLRHFKAVAQEAFSVPHYDNQMIVSEMKSVFSFIFYVSETMAVAANEVGKKIKSALELLHETSIHDKREVVRYMQIIPAAIAAAYIGVSEHALNDWNNYSQVFGASYAGNHCYSLEEAKMIANNRSWIYNSVDADYFRATAPDDEKSLDEVVMVDYDVASALTNLEYDELYKQVPRNRLSKRPFRLSDLEKIRVAKLSAQQQ